MTYLLALDQGTSSSRSIVFTPDGQIVAMAQKEFRQIYPQPGWVEHDPLEIWASQIGTAQEALQKAGIRAQDVAAMGITNQRETAVVWNRETSQPIYNAIVWQDRRGEPACADLRHRGLESRIQHATGLRIDSYFSATKISWLLHNVPGARALAESGKLAFGTIDSWLIWKLTGGQTHATDVSNASRTMVFNIRDKQWDPELLEALHIPAELMPRVQASSSLFGHSLPAWLGAAVPIAGVAGDQQSALFGQACFQPGQAKNTYGTGCFMLMQTGDTLAHSQNGLISTSAAQTGAAAQYAIEGSVFIGGAVVQWLRDGLHAIPNSADVQALAQTVPDTGGVMFVPAFTGLGAPYWQPDARAAIVGLSRGSTMAHIARAALESIAFQSAALLEAMSRDAVAHGGEGVSELRVDGGACVNDLLMQFQADLLGIPVVRPAVIETTALGAAYLAGLSHGVYGSMDELASQWRVERTFYPVWSREQAQERMAQWAKAIRQCVAV